jgi:hypothetical protein
MLLAQTANQVAGPSTGETHGADDQDDDDNRTDSDGDGTDTDSDEGYGNDPAGLVDFNK